MLTAPNWKGLIQFYFNFVQLASSKNTAVPILNPPSSAQRDALVAANAGFENLRRNQLALPKLTL